VRASSPDRGRQHVLRSQPPPGDHAVVFVLTVYAPQKAPAILTGAPTWAVVGLDERGHRRDRMWIAVSTSRERVEGLLMYRISHLDGCQAVSRGAQPAASAHRLRQFGAAGANRAFFPLGLAGCHAAPATVTGIPYRPGPPARAAKGSSRESLMSGFAQSALGQCNRVISRDHQEHLDCSGFLSWLI
jgi:hypothetical protein